MYLKSAVMLCWFVISYVLLITARHWLVAVPACVSLGLSMAAIGFNVQHDGGHGSYSRHAWINRLAALSLDVLGGSSFLWACKHNGLHHTYTNLSGHDEDINLGMLARISPHQPLRFWHRWQSFYLWVLYGFLPIKWQIYDDFADLVHGRAGNQPLPRLRATDWLVFLGGKLIFFSLAFLLPLRFHSLSMVLAAYVLVSFVQGLMLSVVFQLAHCVDGAEFPSPDPLQNRVESTWAEHQLMTTVNFCRSNGVLSWLLGGLNFQVEHHLFPGICHIHYPMISRIIEQTCRDYGIPYRSHPTLASGLAAHRRWLHRMGRQPPKPAS